jgi:uncharacterized NAD-dependent epimerase/dehydratase family protein
MSSKTATAVMPSLALPTPYLLFLGDTTEPHFAKTAYGLRDWAADKCVGEWAGAAATVTTGLPRLAPAEARTRGARSMVIGVANFGGAISATWMPLLLEALEAGLDLIGGLHTRLGEQPELRAAAARLGRRLIDVRVPPANIPVGTGRKRTGKRLLTVGTDCALGKKYTALALTKGLVKRGVTADFRATGQTGILIAGSGMPMDAVVADFEAGAAELLSPDAPGDHWDVIEGQGSLFHPSYAAVSLGLLHGSQPDVIVVCHEASRRNILGFPAYALPTLTETIDLNLTLGRRTNPAIRCAGVSINTSSLSAEEAARYLQQVCAEVGLPAADPIRAGEGLERLIDSCLG